MSAAPDAATVSETDVVRVHYGAAARSAAGVAGDDLPVDGPITLAEVVRRALALHPDSRLADVLQICSTLVGDRPVNAEDPGAVVVAPGSSVEFLPPFAGG
jgi:molybdopterin converting factor small subunit